jgi:hypothetical protein
MLRTVTDHAERLGQARADLAADKSVLEGQVRALSEALAKTSAAV